MTMELCMRMNTHVYDMVGHVLLYPVPVDFVQHALTMDERKYITLDSTLNKKAWCCFIIWAVIWHSRLYPGHAPASRNSPPMHMQGTQYLPIRARSTGHPTK